MHEAKGGRRMKYAISPKIKPWLIGFAAVLYTAIIFWFGIALGMRSSLHQMATEIDNTQAMLAFNRLLDGRKLALLLSKGCVAAAAEKTNIGMDQDTKLLASLFKGKLSPWVTKYIDDRDPTLLSNLDKFKSKYGDSWAEPDCGR